MKKKQIKKNPSGILLITPESLESLLVRESGWVKSAFSSLKYVVIDEFHAFIGRERGQHLLSLLNRLEHLLERSALPIPRVALSATLGELETVPLSLRPNQSLTCETITSTKSTTTLKVQVRGYIDPSSLLLNDSTEPAEIQICHDLYKLCRGGSHLVFANSRKRTESIAAQLRDFCEQNVVPNEFFPHHGSLSKDLREELESRLQKEALPTTAICTMTLELGIDIGKVNSVIQVTAPHSISSLRQRMGRSGRRNDPAILRMLISEQQLNSKSSIVDKLRIELIQSLAMIRLLITCNWFEPADTEQMHFSTLLHQILAVTAQWGGVRVEQLYSLLCVTGPFQKTSVDDFKTLLLAMGEGNLLTQLSSGEITLGLEGEHLVNHYTFYAVFKTPEEFRVVIGNKTLGTLPVDTPVINGQHIVFSGKRWKVIEVDTEKKIIHVERSKAGKPPSFGGSGMSIHDKIRQEMFEIYCSGDYKISIGANKVDYIDTTAKSLFTEGVHYFSLSTLKNSSVIQEGKDSYIFPWMGDKVVNTITAILVKEQFNASSYAGVIEVQDSTVESVLNCLNRVLEYGIPSETELAKLVAEKKTEKYDELLPDDLLSKGYGFKAFDSKTTKSWLMKIK